MNKFGNQPYELPTNTDLEKVLKKNLDHINPVEMREKEINGNKTLFPFWTPVKDAEGVSFTDYKKYLSGREKTLDIRAKKEQVGIVQPKKEGKSYEDDNIIDKIDSIINKHNGSSPFDNSGVVKVVKNAMDGTKTSKQVIDNSVGEPKKVEVDKSAKSKTGVGAVTPKADMGKQTALDITKPSTTQKATSTTKTQIIDNKVGVVKAEVNKSAKSKTGVGAVQPKVDMPAQTKVDVTAGSKKVTGEKVGVVKPKTEKMTADTSKQVTDNKVDKPVEPKVEKAGKPSGDKVGVVKPKADMGKQNVGNLNFDKYKTDHIKGPTFEGIEVGKDVLTPKEKKATLDKNTKERSKILKKTLKETLNESAEKFKNFVNGFKGQGQDDLIESVKKGFTRYFEGSDPTCAK